MSCPAGRLRMQGGLAGRIALRALPFAVNDPRKGIQPIRRLTVVLCALAPRPPGDLLGCGQGALGRRRGNAPSFADYVDLAGGLIRRHGASEPTVTAALPHLLQDMQAMVTDPERQ
jgi:uncharacterized membrane protein